MLQTIAHMTLVLRDYEAIRFFTKTLGFDLIEDTPSKDRLKRSDPDRSTRLPRDQILLAKASNRQGASRIGNQTGGRVFLFLDTDNFPARLQPDQRKRCEIRQRTKTRKTTER